MQKCHIVLAQYAKEPYCTIQYTNIFLYWHISINTAFEEAGNLHKAFPVCLGARVMLTENLWTERGLVNGALRTVRDITWAAGDDPTKDLPLALIVAFDKYQGPTIPHADDGTPFVPVFTSKREFYRGAAQCWRTQFPLTVAWAITVHKSQGITVRKAVLNIARRDFVPGLSYVAVSRVKSLSGIMFEEPFDYSRFRGTPSVTETMRLADKARRMRQMVPLE
jgi:ATP-dependent exoDNAse (exonuclease V) alpha subunit